MQINFGEIRQYLKEFKFEDLFINELGWDHHTQTLSITVDKTEYVLTAIAHKRGMVVYECSQTVYVGHIPNKTTRRKIQKQVSKSTHENFIIYTDADKTKQIWLWVKRKQGKPNTYSEHRYHIRQSGDSLIQKLCNILFNLEEEDEIDIVEVTKRVHATSHAEKVTKRFYDRFKKEHDAFLEFLTGIPDEEMQRWYVSVMLNRLMFIYFIQKKSFLDNDLHYLRTKLGKTQENGRDQYYKEFLCPLFFEGFAKPKNERIAGMENLLGEIPYLNGGIFQKHQLETLHGENIELPDTAFEQIFDFFEQYQWHLDDRPLRNDNEINPDVLGYIFEKYINQKQMGAYYTKEDITEYISKNTIIPFIFDEAHESCKIAFEGDTSVWKYLQEDPDQYIYDAVKKGTEFDLPEKIAVGIHDVSKRTEWNTLASEEFAISTEIWREVVERRQRYEHIQTKLEKGEIHCISDLITYNLDICKLAKHIITYCEGPELLRAFWKAITEVTILDPTCGSGAFLFAALNILEPLYEACLDRMQVFLDNAGEISESRPSPHYTDFRRTIEQLDEHPNHKYFILKTIIIKNLYGVDIMDEAIEICKLRLFLKMVAQIEDVNQIEPLPDIDFNIQAGNTLVGYATYGEVEKSISNKLDFYDTMEHITKKAEDTKDQFDSFREQQTTYGGVVTLDDKHDLQVKLQVLEDELNDYLAREYGVDLSKQVDYEKWINTHKPFHWFIAFYGILQDGGFDVIIGNPPYVEYSKVKKQYTLMEYETEKCGNLYAMSVERSFVLSKGTVGMIVQLPLVCTDRMIPAQSLFKNQKRKSWFANFDDRPGKLFNDLQHIRAVIFLTIQKKDINKAELYSTKYNRWFTEVRSTLFESIVYEDITDICVKGTFPKVANSLGKHVANKLKNTKKSILSFKTGKYICHFHNSPQYWIRATDFVPYFWNEQDGEKISTHVKTLYLTTELDASIIAATLNSSLFYWWFIVLSNCRDLTLREVRSFPIGVDQMDEANKQSLSELSVDLMQDLKRHAQRREANYKATGRVIYDEYFPRHSKPIIDKIDRVLAQHYGFTDEELDFIINYDIKYRMGLAN